MALLNFFVIHWVLAGFAQTFFLHRYGSHRMFSMSRGWEKFFYLFTFLIQGASYLNPRAYAILHRLHHEHSDTIHDPHTPVHSSNVMKMMLKTYRVYSDILYRRNDIGLNFDVNVPSWKRFDRIVTGNPLVPIGFTILYVAIYLKLVTRKWQWLFLPVQILMGPVHGAIVNWFGHTLGYRNYKEAADNSRNTLPLDFLTLGELFQNNHHQKPDWPNLGHKWFEFDPVYPVLVLFNHLGIIQFQNSKMAAGNNT